jgi:hypothetical protein
VVSNDGAKAKTQASLNCGIYERIEAIGTFLPRV